MDKQTFINERYRRNMQFRIIAVIKEKLEKKEIDVEKSKELSKYVLSCFGKGDSKLKIYTAIKNFDLKKYPELLSITIVAIKEKIEDKFQELAIKLGFLLRNKRLDEAENLLKDLK